MRSSSIGASAKPVERLFHQFVVTPQVFYETALSFAFVNIKPLLPGHVLVSPHRVVPRLSDLTPTETADLFITVQRVGRLLERVYSASALNIPLQDGFDAGQSVPHVHVHILPRKPSDLDHEGGPDAIYDRLERADGDLEQQFQRLRPKQPKVDEDSMEPRSDEVMKQEAEMLRLEMAKDLGPNHGSPRD
ncbi:HIT-like protein [Glarea lozoyensis ATCC 20868]|uniref:HIT-like protein n=1 Tax=Glarea lozoyensis (strain ATCC 20868 / MF5171) TaxID=1116229 RepID=S3DP21_GLAL2|nr:HIT-like protein [Glarea lozoyensis ATCC 20868]EPE28213.1 HIT-like protein [Glarea lozoyensis ATCC 20868]